MKYLIVFLVFFAPLAQAKSPKVLMVVNQGFRPEEYFEPRALFDKAGFIVKVAGHYEGKIEASHAHIGKVPAVPVDVLFDKATVDDFDAVVFVGGNGAWNDLLPNPAVHQLLLASYKQNKITALICAATGLLGTADNLNGQTPHFKDKHVTGYFEVEGILKNLGQLKYDGGVPGTPYVVSDDTLITGRDPLSATLFGETVVKAVKAKAHIYQ